MAAVVLNLRRPFGYLPINFIVPVPTDIQRTTSWKGSIEERSELLRNSFRIQPEPPAQSPRDSSRLAG